MKTNISKASDIIQSALTFGINPSLAPMQRICELLGNPQEKFTCIQVAGTNGKSSTSRYLAAILQSFGHRTGLYTSPELISYAERIEIEGRPVDEESFARAIIHVDATAKEDALDLTEFELITAAGLWLFAENKMEYVVLEVGLGGRWDATTVVHPKLAVLTGVDLDHTSVLGNTITEIAQEKIAVLEESTILVMAPTHVEAMQVFKEYAGTTHSPVFEVPLAVTQEENSYQAQNKLTALTAARALLLPNTFDQEAAIQAINNTIIPGRLETLHNNPLLIIDAAHNPASAHMLAQTLDISEYVLLLGVLADKDATGIIEVLCFQPLEIVVTQSSSPRAIPADELAVLVEKISGRTPQVFQTPKDALAVLLKQDNPIVATGSITLAGEVKREFQS